MDPLTAAVGLKVASGVLSGIGNYKAANAQAEEYAALAKIAAKNRQRSNLNYEAQITELETDKALHLDSNRAQWIYSGLTMEGTPTVVNQAVARGYNADIGLTRANQKIEDEIYRMQEKIYRQKEKAAKESRGWGIAGSVLGTATDIASMFID